jgi:DNA-binding MarR family transcriptional regulator
MNYEIPDSIFHARLTAHAKILWAYLNKVKEASKADIAGDTQMSIRGVFKFTKELEKAGALIVERTQTRRGEYRINGYITVTPKDSAHISD